MQKQKNTELANFDIKEVNALQVITQAFLNPSTEGFLKEKFRILCATEEVELATARKITDPTTSIQRKQAIQEAYQPQTELLSFAIRNSKKLTEAATKMSKGAAAAPKTPRPLPPDHYNTPQSVQIKLQRALNLYIKETGGLRGFLTTYQSKKSLRLLEELSKIADEKTPNKNSIENMRTLLTTAQLNTNSRLARKLAEAGVIDKATDITEKIKLKI